MHWLIRSCTFLAVSSVLGAATPAMAASQRFNHSEQIEALGDAHNGAKLIRRYGCGTCHSIPGIPGARGRVGPPLDTIGARTIIAGLLPNTPENMVKWLTAPQSVVPGNAMPDMGLSDDDAKDIMAYLYTLR